MVASYFPKLGFLSTNEFKNPVIGGLIFRLFSDLEPPVSTDQDRVDQLDGHAKDARKCMELISFFVVKTLRLWYVVVVKKRDSHGEISDSTCWFGGSEILSRRSE